MSDRDRPQFLRAVGHGLLAGAAGTAVMTAYQELVSRLRSKQNGNGSNEERDPWEEAPVPAQVARKALRAVGVDPPPEQIPLLTNLMHWAYGTVWGAAYGLLRTRVRINAAAAGAGFGGGVWGASYAQLVPMGLYEPPWEYPLKTVATDLSYHLVYGLGVAAFYGALEC